ILRDINSLTVGGGSVALDAQAQDGNLTLAGYTTVGTLTAKASTNILQTGIVSVGATSSLDAGGDITLANMNNDFGQMVTVVNGQAVTLKDVNSLVVAGNSTSLDA